MSQQQLELGEKIRNFRKRAGLSQLDLEVLTNVSPGTISRIENSQVNPTKETLLVLANSLQLVQHEIADLFNIDLTLDGELAKNIEDEFTAKFEHLIELSEKLADVNDSKKLLTISMNLLLTFTGATAASVWIWNKKEKSMSVVEVSSNIPRVIINVAEKFIGPYRGVKFRLEESMSNNDLIKSFTEGRTVISSSFYDIAFPLMTKNVALQIQKLLRMEKALHLPLMINSEKLGVIGFIFDKKTVSDQEKKFIETVARQVSLILVKLSR